MRTSPWLAALVSSPVETTTTSVASLGAELPGSGISAIGWIVAAVALLVGIALVKGSRRPDQK